MKQANITVAITTAVLFGITGGCGSDKESQRSSGKSEGHDVTVSESSVQFEIGAPEDASESEGISLINRPAQGAEEIEISESEQEPEADDAAPTPEPKPSKRIVIKCKSGVDAISPVANPAVFTIGLEETRGEIAGYEYHKFKYTCGTSGAIVSISDLNAGSKYKINADYYLPSGKLSHQGKTGLFSVGKDGSANVKLLMKKVGPSAKGKVDVDVIFEGGNTPKDPEPCVLPTIACAAVYQPVVCEGYAANNGPEEIALLIGPIKAGNSCEGKLKLQALACDKGVKLLSVKCDEVK